MEQVIFLHAHEDSEEALRQIQQSLSQRLILVAPAQMDRLRLSLLLRLARRSVIAQAKQLCVVSEDRLAQMLAIRMGFAAASSLDEYHSLTPRSGPSFRRRPSRPQTSQPLLTPGARAEGSASSGSLWLTPPMPNPLEQRPATQDEKPRANLEKMLVDGYLQNPAATPDLEEEAERAEREEQERLYYEIADEQQPSQAQQEAEQREEEIIARILKTSYLGTSSPEASAPDPLAEQSTSSPPAAQTAWTEPSQKDTSPEPPAPQLPTHQAAGGDVSRGEQGGSLPSLPTIDEMLREQSRGEIFDWFEQQAAEAATAISGSASDAGSKKSAGGALIATKQPAEATTLAISQTPAGALRLPARIAQPSTSRRSRTRVRLRPPGVRTWRRIGAIGALALSLLMLGTGFALIPYANIGYHEEIIPYSETLLLDARPAGLDTRADAQPAALAQAEVARFDEVLTAQADATGRRTDPNAPDHLIAFPTQDDVDQIASRLQAQMQQWGENALRAQADDGDILGPIIADTEAQAFPPVGTSLPDGVSRFQVSVALHLRAALIRHEALLQATQNQIRRDVSLAKPGFAPQPGQAPDLNILSVEPAGPGEGQLELLVRVQVHALIGPDLTPDQVRKAIAGKDVSEAHDYLARWPGITDVSINVQPAWPGRLPIFSAKIHITVVSIRQDTAQMAQSLANFLSKD